MRSHCPTWRVETPTNSAISSRVRPSSLQSTAESRWKTRRSWAFRRRSLMSFRCWRVNRIVFIAPSRQPHGSTHQGVPPLLPTGIIGNSGLARLYNLTPAFLDRLYGPSYRALEAPYLRALAAAREPRQRRRLELLGRVLTLLQWNLKAQGALP